MDPRIDGSLAWHLFESSHVPLLLVEIPTGEIVAANRRAAQLLDLPEPAKGSLLNLGVGLPEHAERVRGWLEEQAAGGGAASAPPLPLATRCGKLHAVPAGWLSRSVVLLQISSVGDVAQSTVAARAAQRPHADRDRTHADPEALIRELEARNAELEQFAYTVSHDLKSPLITIKGFVGCLEQDLAAGNRDDIAKDVAMISSAANTMKRLLDDILELSRIGRIVNPSEPVDLQDVAREVCDALATRIAKCGATVSVAPGLPRVYGDRTRLVEVLLNLVDNALKFAADVAQPRVEIGVRDEQSPPVIFVRDNGLGMQPEYFERAFHVFEKLSRDSEGTGIGLAIVRRIVDVHGGRVWVESQGTNQGCTLCFTLPSP